MHQNLQAQFKNRTVCKRYVALVGWYCGGKRRISRIPLRPDPEDRPRQVVDVHHGKPAVTDYRVLRYGGCKGGLRTTPTVVSFVPKPGVPINCVSIRPIRLV
ncbi:MAG: hypothetical protein V8T12_02610 [Parabacteroides johnsonii]